MSKTYISPKPSSGSGSAITALTGDATATGPGSVPLTLATVNSSPGVFGSSTSINTVTVNAKGLVTSITSNAVIAPAGTLTGTTLASNVVSSSLTMVGTITSGTWNGTTIAVANGGTSLTSLTANNVILGNGTSAPTFVAPGSSGNVLTSNGTTWISQAASASGGGAPGSITYYYSANSTSYSGQFAPPVLLSNYGTGSTDTTYTSSNAQWAVNTTGLYQISYFGSFQQTSATAGFSSLAATFLLNPRGLTGPSGTYQAQFGSGNAIQNGANANYQQSGFYVTPLQAGDTFYIDPDPPGSTVTVRGSSGLPTSSGSLASFMTVTRLA